MLPFATSSGDQNTEYLSDGITESIINTFSQLPTLRVMARATVFRYKGKDTDPRQVGRDLGVDAVVTGRVMQQSDTLGIQADLVRVSDGSQLWGERFDRKLADVLAVQDEIASRITDRLRLRLTGAEQQLVTKHHTENTEAYDLYLKGRFYFVRTTEESLERSLSFYQQAIARDRTTLWHMSDWRRRMPRWAACSASGRRAKCCRSAHMPPPPPCGWTQAGGRARGTRRLSVAVRVELGGRREGAQEDPPEPELQRPTRLRTASPAAGRLEGSDRERPSPRRSALAVGPANAGYPTYARRCDEAIRHYRKAVDLDRGTPGVTCGSDGPTCRRAHAEAVHAIEEAIRLSGGDTRAKATLAHAYAIAGRRAEATKILGELVTQSAHRYVSPYFLALVYVGLKDDGRALAALEAAAEERHPYLTLLNVEPVFDRLRSQARFSALVRKVGLTDQSAR